MYMYKYVSGDNQGVEVLTDFKLFIWENILKSLDHCVGLDQSQLWKQVEGTVTL